MTTNSDRHCPVCGSQATISRASTDAWRVDCVRCGHFSITGTADGILPYHLKEDARRWAKLSHAIRNAQDGNNGPEITAEIMRSIWKTELPRPLEQAAKYVILLGRADIQGGEYKETTFSELKAALGTEDRDDGRMRGIAFVVEHLTSVGLIESRKPPAGQSVYLHRLSMKGWERFRALTIEAVDSRLAFMAMAYGQTASEEAFNECFFKAVGETGFNLLRLDKLPKAGHIDLRMRVEIRTAKFLVADLTDDNRGAYWEAGFAEGLGRPVFYTCEEAKFDRLKSHFDTEHLLTIRWSASDFGHAKEELKAAIRNTFPLAAKMHDG